ATVAILAASAFVASDLGAPMAALVALTPMALAEAWVALPEVCGAKARSRAAESRLATVLDRSPAVIADPDLPALEQTDDTAPVHLQSVSASWTSDAGRSSPDGGPVSTIRLDLDSLEVGPLRPGERVQLTGPNGVGKSTALAVLARHLDPLSGTYTLASRDVRALTVDSVRARIAVVDDEPHAFAGSVRANLALAAPAAGDDAMLRALDRVDLRRWLDGLPEGLDTHLRGISGGERARLSMARAVLSARPLVLLDEPTAHLDDASAECALGGLGDFVVAPIVVAVSHRPLPWTDFVTVALDRPDVLSA
ncbi:MAG: ATP-binding cassette domain-containing protein, partial [Ornithinimicrobium sp.]